jgi:hypothetical protein
MVREVPSNAVVRTWSRPHHSVREERSWIGLLMASVSLIWGYSSHRVGGKEVSPAL